MAEFDIGTVAGYVLVILLVFSLYYIAATLNDGGSGASTSNSKIDKEAENIREDLMKGLDDIDEKLNDIGDVIE